MSSCEAQADDTLPHSTAFNFSPDANLHGYTFGVDPRHWHHCVCEFPIWPSQIPDLISMCLISDARSTDRAIYF